MTEIKMYVPADYNFIPGVRTCISRIALNFGFNDREAYHIETIVDEVCNNAIEHGGKGRNKRFVLNCAFQKSVMELIVKDSGGKKFNVREIFQRNMKALQEEASELPARGRGLIIVQKLVDKLDINVAKSGTTVKITKRAKVLKGTR